jgi:uncharacterized protein
MLYKRLILNKIKKVINREEFVILTGARQTGKTSILLMLKDFLTQKGKQCFYFNLENQENLNLLNKAPYNIFELLPESTGKVYVFLDEIQYLENPTNFLKLLYDEKREKIKIICSGSSSFYIDRNFKDSLVGRKFLFEIFPLSFEEFIIFKGKEDEFAKWQKKSTVYYAEIIEGLWKEYLIFGGYPKAALAESEEMKKIILEEIGSDYIKKDVFDAGIKNTEKYFALMKVFAGQSGQMVNMRELSDLLDISRLTVDEYVYTMQKSYQIALVRPFFKNIRKELTKMPKVFFYDLGLRNFFLNNFNAIEKREDKGAYLENIVFRELLNTGGKADKIKFWRTKNGSEVDFIAGQKAYEIKFSSKMIKEKKYEKFSENYPELKLEYITFDNVLKKFYQ